MNHRQPYVGGYSPWGQADRVTVVAEGIVFVSTPSHGGFWVRPDLLERIPTAHRAYAAKWSLSEQWYEEDCCALAVIAAFPEHFPQDNAEECAERLDYWMQKNSVRAEQVRSLQKGASA